MRRLRIIGTAATVALAAAALAPGSALADQVSAFASFTQEDTHFADGGGNKIDSDFFASFSFRTDLDTSARIGTIAGTDSDGDSIGPINKTQFESGPSAPLQATLSQSFTAEQDDGISFARSEATVSGSTINRGGTDEPGPLPNFEALTQGNIELNAPNTGRTTTEMFVQVFDFAIADGIENESLVLNFDAALFLETIETGDLFATSMGADANLTISVLVGGVEVSLLDLDTLDEFAFGDSLLGGVLDDPNQLRDESRSFSLVAIDAAGDEILFSEGMTGSFTVRQEANTATSAAAVPVDIPAPATMMLLGTGLLGLGIASMHRARRRKEDTV